MGKSGFRDWRGFDVGTGLVVLVVVGLHLLFAHNDTRILWDPGRYYIKVPEYYWSFRTLQGALSSLGGALVASSGWYEWCIAGLMRIFGRSPDVMLNLGAVWLGLVLLFTGAVGRRLAGPAGGLAAVAITAAIPSVTVFARFAWIHVPEAALVMAMAWLVTIDPALTRWRTVFGLGVLGALTLQLRESGVVWVAPMAPLLILTVRASREEGRWRRLAVLAFLWFIAALPSMTRMYTYLRVKIGARSRYAMVTPPLKDQFAEALSMEVTWLIAAGAFLTLLFLYRKRQPVFALLILWSLIPILLFVVFYAGFTNYTPFMPAMAILAGTGLAWLHPSLVIIPVGVLIFGFRAWLPFPLDQMGRAIVPDIRLMMRPSSGWGTPDVAALLDATCTSDEWRSCHIVVEQGLFYPGSEEYGLFELFQLGEDRVELRTISDSPEEGWESYGVDALAFYYCAEKDDGFLRRGPDSIEKALSIVQIFGLEVAYSDRTDTFCDYYWLTPGGVVAAPEKLPVAWNPGLVHTWSTDGAWAVHWDFQARNGDFTNHASLIRTYGEDIWPNPNPPVGWSAEGAAENRARAVKRLQARSAELRKQQGQALQPGRPNP